MSLTTQFKDIHAFDPGYGYVVPNESLQVWRKLLQGIRAQRAAGICSSGEVGLFGLLTRTQRELVLVDHSYKSLAIAMLKFAALREYGAEKTRKTFLCNQYAQIVETFTELKKALPASVSSCATPTQLKSWSRSASIIAREWKDIPTQSIKSAASKLDLVKFLHGDLVDLVDKGPFDILYLSNALEHTDRNRRRPMREKIEKIVKPGGYIIATRDRFGFGSEYGWEIVRAETGKPKHHGHLQWSYALYRTPQEVAH